jgi:hypothetical protein
VIDIKEFDNLLSELDIEYGSQEQFHNNNNNNDIDWEEQLKDMAKILGGSSSMNINMNGNNINPIINTSDSNVNKHTTNNNDKLEIKTNISDMAVKIQNMDVLKTSNSHPIISKDYNLITDFCDENITTTVTEVLYIYILYILYCIPS